ncbi:MAG TPA: CPBP family glutamic-type intramembrane protease [Myxococcota bacterium]|nr:CPBP family glutamic-type intramembrane protease [Myxococcota bacterium]
MATRKDTGWGPYWLPMLAFLLLIEVGRRVPDSAAGFFLVLRVLVPGALVTGYAARGRYPELRGFRADARVALDVAVGLLGALLWIAPFLLYPGLRPNSPGFDPTRPFGPDGAALALSLRGVGYAVVTPFVEELFVRSWLLRYAQVWSSQRDFRNVPMARFTLPSFAVTTAYFVFTHQPWEWGVMFTWTLLTMAWFYHRRHIVPLILVHAVTNGAIFALVWLADGRVHDATGAVVSLWFLL